MNSRKTETLFVGYLTGKVMLDLRIEIKAENFGYFSPTIVKHLQYSCRIPRQTRHQVLKCPCSCSRIQPATPLAPTFCTTPGATLTNFPFGISISFVYSSNTA